MTAYTDAAKIANFLGATLTGAQQNQAGVLADAATAWIERYTGRSWQIASPVTDELHTVVGDRVYLAKRPVVAVTALSTRQEIAGGDWSALGAGEYELLDADAGVVLVSGWGSYLVKVTYTHAMTTAPADVTLAATMIAASWMASALAPNTNGLASVSTGQNDVAVKFSERRGDVPTEALSILKSYRSIVIA